MARGRERVGPAGAIGEVETWIFDLDNTLYPPEARLMDQVDARMTAYIMRELGVDRAEADRIRAEYWLSHGITLRGLVEHHGADPDRFLAETHAIDLSEVAPDPALAAAIRRLPGRKIVHTNGARGHAEGVLAAVGLAGAFERVFAIEDKGLIPKPDPRSYAIVIEEARIDPRGAVMIEDTVQNLLEPWRLGMGTVWLDRRDPTRAQGMPPGDRPGALPDYVDLRITDLLGYLGGATARPERETTR